MRCVGPKRYDRRRSETSELSSNAISCVPNVRPLQSGRARFEASPLGSCVQVDSNSLDKMTEQPVDHYCISELRWARQSSIRARATAGALAAGCPAGAAPSASLADPLPAAARRDHCREWQAVCIASPIGFG